MNQQTAPTSYTAAELTDFALQIEHHIAQNYSADLLQVIVSPYPFHGWPTLLACGIEALLHEHPQPAVFLASLIKALVDLSLTLHQPQVIH